MAAVVGEQCVDVLVVGAGLSGIGAAYHLQKFCPTHTYAIIEQREAMGGTWDLFRYPGIRSDSDMYTLGYSFKPWTHGKGIASGESIREYIRETAKEHGIDAKIRYGVRVSTASWSSADARWTVDVTVQGAPFRYSCNFLFLCTGYYSYDKGYTPEFPGVQEYRGRLVHPQKWVPADEAACRGKKVVVIGSGATAITLIPSLAGTAEHVTMLQRSPTYMLTVPEYDPFRLLFYILPTRTAHALVRVKSVVAATLLYYLSKRFPRAIAGLMKFLVRLQLAFGRGGAGPGMGWARAGEEVRRNFSPTYDPWDQRVCLIPDNGGGRGGDLYRALKKGQASVVTDRIDTFTATGLRLKSGKELDADVVITATGLNVQFAGGIQFLIDGERVDMSTRMLYRGMMLSGCPNLANVIGYTNASWTLKAELIDVYVCRLLNHMRSNGLHVCYPKDDPSLEKEPALPLKSSYVMRAVDKMPKIGKMQPWRNPQNYFADMREMGNKSVDDGTMVFSALRTSAMP